jgi:DNA mismatch repair protein MutS
MNAPLTPMMNQWHLCKQKASDAVLLFRLGDFYEAFYQDAEKISKDLSLTLTQRQNVPMCGVPYHAAESYIDKLISKGYKVAIAEQMEDPKTAKGLVSREITRIITPGTLISSELLVEKSNNFFISISQVGSFFGIALIDLTTTEFKVLELEHDQILDEIYRLKPSEILISKKFKEHHASLMEEMQKSFSFTLTEEDDWFFDHELATQTLLGHFKVQSLDGFGLKGMVAAINAAGALFKHLIENLQFSLSHIQTISQENLSSYMNIDYTCMNNLELFETHSSLKDTTLFSLLDHTKTPMGGRLFHRWLKKPLLNKEEILSRQESIQELIDHSYIFSSLIQHLDKIRDLERLITKIACHQASPKDLVALRFSLEILPFLKKDLEKFQTKLLQQSLSNMHNFEEVSTLIQNALIDSPPFRLSDGGSFKKGYNAELDEWLTLQENSKNWIINYQNQLKEETSIKTLKVGFTKAFGYYIEVSKGQVEKIPETFQRRQTLINGERFITPELKEFEHKILHAEEKIKSLESRLFLELTQKILSFSSPILQTSQALAQIDALFSLAQVAKAYNYVRPVIDESQDLWIEEGRHPILEKSLATGKFIPNDTHLISDEERIYLITGPNMAGKSTYIRQVALLVIMAQMGSYIPCKNAKIGIVDRIFSRIGASDDLSRGQSTFMVEMSETANILNNATNRSLVILDEIGRGTSTYDGIAIAWAVCEYLIEKKIKTLFATHYWELTELEKKFIGIKNYNVAVQETSNGIVFLRKIVPGGTDKSYGIHVAKLAGIPLAVLKKAQEMLLHLEKQAPRKKIDIPKMEQMSFLPEPPHHLECLESEIKNLDVNRLSPLEALQKLFEIKQKLIKK